MSTLIEIPQWEANAISATQASKPPSERSWYASNLPSLRSSIMAEASAFRSSGWSTFGATLPDWLRTWARILPAIRFFPRPRSIKISSVSKALPLESFNIKAGVKVLRTSMTEANAEMIAETGETTFLGWSPSRHSVAIDKESLPTGIEIPNAGQRFIPIAWTES